MLVRPSRTTCLLHLGSRTCLSDPEQHACQSQDMFDIPRWTTCLSDPGGQHACHTWEDNMPVTPRRTTCMSDPGRKHARHTWEYNMSDIPRRTCQSELGQYACQTMEDMSATPRTTCLSDLGGQHACQTQ